MSMRSNETGPAAESPADLIFHDVDVDTTWTEMTINTQGPVRQTLQIIESPPLRLMEIFEVPYQKLSGTNETHLYLKFPLLDDLQAKQMDYVKNEIVMNKLLNFLKKESKYE